MKASWTIFSIRGIAIRIHATFLLLLAWFAASSWIDSGRAADAAASVGLILGVFGCVVLHELGHAAAARRYGLRTSDITLLPIGGIARLQGAPPTPRAEIVIALAGPAVNIAIAGVLWAFTPADLNGLLDDHDPSIASSLLGINLSLAAFNLIPAFPMDGGRVLRALLALRYPAPRATQLAAWVGQVIAIGFAMLGLLYYPMLVLIAIFVWFGAAAEAGEAQLRSAIAGVALRDVLITHFIALAPGQTLAAAVAATLAGTQKDFPVVDGDRVVGVLTQTRLLEALRQRGDAATIEDWMERNVATADVGEALSRVWQRIGAGRAKLIAVLDDGRLAGLVDVEHVAELVRIRGAIAAAVRRTSDPGR